MFFPSFCFLVKTSTVYRRLTWLDVSMFLYEICTFVKINRLKSGVCGTIRWVHRRLLKTGGHSDAMVVRQFPSLLLIGFMITTRAAAAPRHATTANVMEMASTAVFVVIDSLPCTGFAPWLVWAIQNKQKKVT